MSTRLMWLPVDAADALLDPTTSTMSTEAYGAHWLLSLHAMRAEPIGTLPLDDRRLAQITRLGAVRWAELRSEVLAAWEIDGDRLRCPWVAEIARRQRDAMGTRTEAARRAARTRWSAGVHAPDSMHARADASESVPADAERCAQVPIKKGKKEKRENEIPPPPQGEPPRPATPTAAEPRKRSRSRQPPDPSAAELRAYYLTRWVELLRPTDGQPPHLDAADNRAAIALVERYGIDAAREFVDRYFVDPDPWLGSTGHRLRHLPSRVDAYRAQPVRTGPVYEKYEELIQRLGI